MNIRDRVKEFRRVPASELRPNPKNWRKHPEAQVNALRGLLAEVGFAGAELARECADGSLMLIDGHARAEIMGTNEVPVLVLDVTEAEADKLLATFDPIGAMAVADKGQLDALLRNVQTDSESVALMLTELGKNAGCDWAAEQQPTITEDEAPALPVDPITKPGDLWLLGDHRLLCGDSTSAVDVTRLMGGKLADLCFTSPPYGQQRDYTAEGKEKCADWDGLMRGVFGAMPMAPDGQVLVNLGMIHQDGEWQPYWDGWIAWMRTVGWKRFGFYVWDQTHGLRGDWNGRCAPSHEFIFHFNRMPKRPTKWIECDHAGERGGELRNTDGTVTENRGKTVQSHKIPDSVWRVTRQMGGIEGHPAPFSVALATHALKSWPGLVYEPFSGSGTTIIAAEQLSRICCAMEISPLYCDVAVARWEKLTGKNATRQPVAAKRAAK